MSKDIAQFQVSTEEDLGFRLTFIGLVLTGKTLEVQVKDRASNTVRTTLTIGAGLALAGADAVTYAVARASMATWPRGEYQADLVDTTSGRKTIMAVRFVFDEPGKLVYGVRGTSATINWSPNQAVVTAYGATGPAGPANTLGIGTVTTGSAGSSASASITGTAPNQTLNLTIPRGNTGNAATIAVASTTTGAPGTSASVVNAGTSSAASLQFTIPRGDVGPANTLGIGAVTTGAPGSAAGASITGTAPNQTLNLTLPRGLNGAGGSTAEVLGASGITDQPSLVVDFLRNEFFAAGKGIYSSISAMVVAMAGNSALSRSTTATYFDRDGLLKTAAINESRTAYDPLTRRCRGRMAEPARTNLLLRSQDFTNAAWVKTGITVTPAASIAPDGTLTMSRITESSVNEVHRVYQDVAVTSGSTYAFSLFAREPAGNLNKRYLVLLLPSTQFGANIRIAVDLATGAFTSTGSPLNPEVDPIGNGIWRVSFSATATATGTSNCQILISDTNTGSFAAFLGDGVSSLEYWGTQGEAGLGTTSYIPTTTVAVARGADILTLDSAPWLVQGRGTFLIDVEFDVPNGGSTWFDANDGTVNNRVALRSSSVLQAQTLIYDANVLQTNTVVLIAAQDTSSAIAIGYQTNDVGSSGNGAATLTDNTAAIPLGINRLNIGGRSSVEPLTGYVRRILYFPNRLSNANLQALSGIAWPASAVAIGAGSVGTNELANKAASNDKLADMAGSTLKGRLSTTGAPQDLTVSQVAGLLGGTTGSTLALGNDSRLTNTRTPTDGTVVNASVHSSAGIVASKLSYLALAAGSVARSVQSLFDRVTIATNFNVDPTGATASTAGMQAAINAASTTGVLLVPKGDYLINGTLTISASLRIIFEVGARLVAAPSAGASPVMISATGVDGLHLVNVTILGNGVLPSGDPGTGPQCIYLTNCDDVLIDNVDIRDWIGTALAFVACEDALVRGGRFIDTGQDVAGETLPYHATPAIWSGAGSTRVKIRDVHFEGCLWSGVFLFSSYSDVVDCTFNNIGESAIYSESIDPATNGGVEVRYNRFAGNKIRTTRIKDISAAGMEILTHDTIIEGNTIIDAGTHGIALGCADRIVCRGNIIGNCNGDNEALNAGIIATIHTGVWNGAAFQGDQIIIANNVIYDQTGLMKSGIQWHSLNIGSYVFRRAIDQGNSFTGLPAGMDRVLTVGCMVDDPLLAYGPVIGPDSSWKSHYMAAPGVGSTNSTSVAVMAVVPKKVTLPPHYLLNKGAVRITASGAALNTNGTKTCHLYVGGASLGSFTFSNTPSWRIEADLVNTAYNAQRYVFRYIVDGAVAAIVEGAGGFGTNAALDIEIRGLVAHAGDFLTCYNLTVEKITG